MKIKINDIVKSKNSEGMIQSAGRVVALFSPDYYLSIIPQEMHDSLDISWGENWKNNPVVAVYFDKPQKTATLEEWIKTGMAKGISKEELEETYPKAPLLKTVTFRMDDLISVSDDLL